MEDVDGCSSSFSSNKNRINDNHHQHHFTNNSKSPPKSPTNYRPRQRTLTTNSIIMTGTTPLTHNTVSDAIHTHNIYSANPSPTTSPRLEASSFAVPPSSSSSSSSSLSSLDERLGSLSFNDNSDDESITSAASSTKTATENANDDHDSVSSIDNVIDRYGFLVVPSSVEYEKSKNFKSNRKDKTLEKEAERAIKWSDMLRYLEDASANKEKWPKLHKKFKERLAKGIPNPLRPQVWALMNNMDQQGNILQSSTSLTSTTSLNNSSSSTDHRTFVQLYSKISGFERQIDLDIERTLRDHISFKARFSDHQISLFKVLVAYSNLDVEVGYCQGMSTIVAFLLLYYEEEAAFKMLKALMAMYSLRNLFKQGFPLLFECFWIQEDLMTRFMPELASKLFEYDISTSVYATKWYLTLFLGFPMSLSTRIWDLLMYWGLDILICVSLALLKIHEKQLLSLEYEHCMELLSKLPETPLDEDRVVDVTMKIWKKMTKTKDKEQTTFYLLHLRYEKSSSV